jgi:hypothetical protein
MRRAEALLEVIHNDCHNGIHTGFPARQALRNAALESDVR